ncbi:TetR/AcrR family transcriptional regulator [Phycicoccus flavus]|uniref:TetR/AcrR family transcriptional regulator n=1 Tax=Phycicoccus flavus TaxID=2502783 RepID=UPI000FEBE2CB|nr:TetR family transcriptional regulator [Phycicoccus flavus]NHA69798.1 TetR family transcriptional regulator [Phycicoccus flavus]
MARPRTVTDEQLLDAAARVLMAGGPDRFTLAAAAAEAGVSAATFVGRFGSKEAIPLLLSRRWVAGLDAELAGCVAGTESPLQRLREVALQSYRDLDHPDTAANQLAVLAVDLQRADLRELLDSGWGIVRRHLARHAAAATTAGELHGAPAPERLARVVAAAMEGGCLSWSVRPDGPLVDRLAADLDTILDPYTRKDAP